MPTNHRLRANEVEYVLPPGPPFGDPHPEGAIEASKLRSLRSTTEHRELLSECQVLESEVRAASERRAEGAQQSECKGQCRPWLSRRSPTVQSRDRVLANDTLPLPALRAPIQNSRVAAREGASCLSSG